MKKLSRRQMIQTSAGLVTASTLFGGNAMAKQKDWKKWADDRLSLKNKEGLPIPSKNHLAWHDCEVGMFYHFDIPIYQPGWNWRSFKNLPDPNLYNPVKLNTDQWLEAAKAIGAKYAVFVAKHCSGFLSWQSNSCDYGVKQSKWRDGKGDVVKDFIESCHKYGIKPGLYASVTANCWYGVDNPGTTRKSRSQVPVTQEQYARACEIMCEELWSNYGELFEIWFDGGALASEKGGPDLIPLIAKHQPQAMVFQGPAGTIRWIGNERGVANYPNWSTVSKRDGEQSGNPDGKIWQPGECDVPIRNHHWFWGPNQDHSVYSLDALVDMYYRSVGHNSNLLLNANPDPSGLIPEADMQRYKEFGAEIKKRFGNPIASTSGKDQLVELILPKAQRIDHIILQEDLAQGERVREYEIEVLKEGGKWNKIAEGSAIGHKRIQAFHATETSKIRVRINKATANPLISNFAAFNVGKTAGIVEDIRYNNLKGFGSRVIYVSSEHKGNEGRNVFDANPNTIWHSEWEGPKKAIFPHEIQIDMLTEKKFVGFKQLPRQSVNWDWITDYGFYASNDPGNWGKPIAKGTFGKGNSEQRVKFDKTVKAQYIRLVALAANGNKSICAIAELDVIINA